MAPATRLYGDEELHVLWLTAGRQELALSSDGVWLRNGRRRGELTWEELAQIQAGDVLGGGRGSARIEVFAVDGRVRIVGPFAREPVLRWLTAAAGAARAAGARPRPLDGADGFALASSGRTVISRAERP